MRSREQADALQGELQVSDRKFAKHLRDLRHRWHKARMSHDWIQLHKLNSKVSPAHPPAWTLRRNLCVTSTLTRAAAWPIQLQTKNKCPVPGTM